MTSVDQPTLSQLQEQVQACKACPLWEGRTNVVFGVGNPDARVLIVGEAPGKNEDEQGEPFVGAAGKKLDALLALAGLTRDEVYIANVLKCRPPSNRDPQVAEIEACTPYLRAQTRCINPEFIVTLGNFATKFILKTEVGITQLHGKKHQAGRFTVFPIFHPAAAIYDRSKQEALEQDFRTLGEMLAGSAAQNTSAASAAAATENTADSTPANTAPDTADSMSANTAPDSTEDMADFDPVAYINNPNWRASSMGLSRITELMQRLGNPQETLRFVHVAGTNGKGSTCAFVARILQCAGYTTGLFTSPYIIEFAERIRVNGQNIPADDLLAITLRVREHAEAMEDHPTEFELMTAVAMEYFAAQQCDIVVMEVGLGGRLDSTNIIAHPDVCAIAPIALDHTDLLGSTLGEIAGEKVGIIKPGASVVAGVQQAEALEVIKQSAKQAGCAFTSVDAHELAGTPQSFSYRLYTDLSIGLLGSYQPENAALAIEIIEALRARGFAITDDQLREGLRTTSWPARFQVVAESPTFIVDGGHNLQGAQALASSLAQSFPDMHPVFLMGVLADKDYESMLDTVVGLAQSFVCISPPSPRALAAEDLAHAIEAAAQRTGANLTASDIHIAASIDQGVAQVREIASAQGLVCAFGSLYSVSSIMDALNQDAAQNPSSDV